MQFLKRILTIGFFTTILFFAFLYWLGSSKVDNDQGDATESVASSSPEATASPSSTISIKHSNLDFWFPSSKARTHGFDILIEEEPEKDDLVAFVKEKASKYDPVIIRIYTSREAFEAIMDDDLAKTTDADEKGYILHYVKNTEAGSERLTWFQEIGKYAEFYGEVE